MEPARNPGSCRSPNQGIERTARGRLTGKAWAAAHAQHVRCTREDAGSLMAFTESELKMIDRTVGTLCRRVSPAAHADQLRFVYDVDGHAVSIFEERPPWDGRPGDWTRMGVARFRYYRSRDQWALYWMRRDLKWHLYDPARPRRRLAALVDIVEADHYCAFFG